ncbi:hypothetical protein DFH28DRAFT_1218995 [Melampsora americana]|nr:hypothetical protein DFH28DRAFT_1218995 [Melampsora americana]
MTSRMKGSRRESRFFSTMAKFLYMMTILCLPCMAAKGELKKRMTRVDHITQPLLYKPLNGQRDGPRLSEDYATAKKVGQAVSGQYDKHPIKIENVAWHAPESYGRQRYKTQVPGNPHMGTRMEPIGDQSVSVDEVRSEQARYLPLWVLEEDKNAFRKWVDKRFGRKFKQSEKREFYDNRGQKDSYNIDVYMNSARKKWMYKKRPNYYYPQSYYKDPHHYFNKWWNIQNRRMECYGNYWKLFKVGVGEALTAARKNIKYFFRRLEWFFRKGK